MNNVKFSAMAGMMSLGLMAMMGCANRQEDAKFEQSAQENVALKAQVAIFRLPAGQ